MVLLVLSILALVTAALFALFAWTVVRDDRRRSAARVAALASTALVDDATSVVVADGRDAAGFMVRDPRAMVAGHPLVKVAVGAAMSIALIVFIAMNGGHRETREPSAATTTAAMPQQDGSLELLSMRYERDGDTLAVTGLVRNGGGAAARDLTAVVFTFDRAGNFVASGRAPLEFTTLAPGDESPFTVTIPNVSDVGRYRVSFRTDAGVVRHVDRRAALEAAAR
jgi:hypothetical protein